MASRFNAVFVLLAAACAPACALDVDASGAGKACSEGRCAAGYDCNAANRCVANVPSDDVYDAAPSAGGAAALPAPPMGNSAGGATALPASPMGNSAGRVTVLAGAGGSAGEAASSAGGAVAAGGPGAAHADASAPQKRDGGAIQTTSMDASGTASDAACDQPTRYYRDDDGDGFGRSDVSAWFCGLPRPGFAAQGGDCNDMESRAFPGQTAYFGTPYDVAGGDSFDYDCSGGEEPDPAAAPAAPDCPALALLVCTGSGFAKTGRTGGGVDPTCGSAQMVTCSGLLACTATTSTVPRKGCR